MSLSSLQIGPPLPATIFLHLCHLLQRSPPFNPYRYRVQLLFCSSLKTYVIYHFSVAARHPSPRHFFFSQPLYFHIALGLGGALRSIWRSLIPGERGCLLLCFTLSCLLLLSFLISLFAFLPFLPFLMGFPRASRWTKLFQLLLLASLAFLVAVSGRVLFSYFVPPPFLP